MVNGGKKIKVFKLLIIIIFLISMFKEPIENTTDKWYLILSKHFKSPDH